MDRGGGGHWPVSPNSKHYLIELATRNGDAGSRLSHDSPPPSHVPNGPSSERRDARWQAEYREGDEMPSAPVTPPRQPVTKETRGSRDQTELDFGLTDAEEAMQRTNGNIAFSCFVFWCCNMFFGAVAFFVSINSRDATVEQARRLGNITLVINIAGIITSWILVALIVALWWYGVIDVWFAPWRISHYYEISKEDTGM